MESLKELPMFSPFEVVDKHAKTIVSLKFSPLGNLLLSASADKAANVYSRNGQLLTSLQGHSSGLNDCAWIGNNFAATCSDDSSVLIWDIEMVCYFYCRSRNAFTCDIANFSCT